MANRRQHTIPQFYLRPFLSPGWVYRRGASAPRDIKSPASVAVQRDYYGRDEAARKTLDDINSSIEDKAAPSFTKLINRPETITPADRVLLSFLFANIFVRNPVHIRIWSDAIIAAANKIGQMAQQTHGGRHKALVLIGDPSKFRPEQYVEAPTVSLDELRERAAMLRQKGGHCIAADDNFGALEEIAKCIEQMAFKILEAPKGLFFVTSDRPLTLQRRKTGSQSGAGWANDDALSLIALSPTRFLLMFYTDLFDMVQTAATPEQVAAFNVEVIRFADEEIYSASKYPEADDWMNGVGRWRLQG